MGTYTQVGLRRRLPEFVAGAHVHVHVLGSTASSGKPPTSQPCLLGEAGG